MKYHNQKTTSFGKYKIIIFTISILFISIIVYNIVRPQYIHFLVCNLAIQYIINGNDSKLQQLINWKLIDSKDINNFFPEPMLIVAVRYNRLTTCKLLLDAGADYNHNDCDSALISAVVKNENVDILKLLFAYGTKIDRNHLPPSVANITNLSMIDLIIDHGINPQDLIYYSSYSGNTILCDYCLRKLAKINSNEINIKELKNAENNAAKRDHYEVQKIINNFLTKNKF